MGENEPWPRLDFGNTLIWISDIKIYLEHGAIFRESKSTNSACAMWLLSNSWLVRAALVYFHQSARLQTMSKHLIKRSATLIWCLPLRAERFKFYCYPQCPLYLLEMISSSTTPTAVLSKTSNTLLFFSSTVTHFRPVNNTQSSH